VKGAVMKNLIIAVLISISTLAGGISINAGTGTTGKCAYKSSSTVEEYVYVRVFENGQWWIYVYTLNGSFVVVIPDEDED
jgi:hypothetical protein